MLQHFYVDGNNWTPWHFPWGLAAAMQLHLSVNPNTLLQQASCCTSVAYMGTQTTAIQSPALTHPSGLPQERSRHLD